MSVFDVLPYELCILIIEFVSIDEYVDYCRLCSVNSTFYDLLRGSRMNLMKSSWENVLEKPIREKYSSREISSFTDFQKAKTLFGIEMMVIRIMGFVRCQGLKTIFDEYYTHFLVSTVFLYSLLKICFTSLSILDLIPVVSLFILHNVYFYVGSIGKAFLFYTSQTLERRPRRKKYYNFNTQVLKSNLKSFGNSIFSVGVVYLFFHILIKGNLDNMIVISVVLVLLYMLYLLSLYSRVLEGIGKHSELVYLPFLRELFAVLGSLYIFSFASFMKKCWIIEHCKLEEKDIFDIQLFYSITFSLFWLYFVFDLNEWYWKFEYWKDHNKFRLIKFLFQRLFPCLVFTLVVFRSHTFFVLLAPLIVATEIWISSARKIISEFEWKREMDYLWFLATDSDVLELQYAYWLDSNFKRTEGVQIREDFFEEHGEWNSVYDWYLKVKDVDDWTDTVRF